MENNFDETTSHSKTDAEELISPTKFTILSIASLGLYPIWWSYKAWVFFRDRENSNVLPAGRAILNWIFFSALLNRIRSFAGHTGHEIKYKPWLLHVIYILLLLCSYLPTPFFFVSFFNFVVFLEPLKALNAVKLNTPDMATYERPSFNNRQLALVIFGLILWIFAIVGQIVGETS